MKAIDGYPLVGGRLDYVDGRRVGALGYVRRRHVISVFFWPSTTIDLSGTRTAVPQGYNLVRFSSDGIDYCAVSDLNAAELGDFRSKLGEQTVVQRPIDAM